MTQKSSKLILPRTAAVSRREALKMGAVGIGGLAVGGSVLAACGGDDGGSTATTATTARSRPRQSEGPLGLHRPARRQRLD